MRQIRTGMAELQKRRDKIDGEMVRVRAVNITVLDDTAVKMSTAALADLSRPRDDERALYDDLRDNRIRPQLRLEQERVGFNYLSACLQAMLAAP